MAEHFLEVTSENVSEDKIRLRCTRRSLALDDTDGSMIRVFGTILDIAAEKEAEEAMERASLVFEHSSKAIAIADAAGRSIMVNPGFTRMRGYRKTKSLDTVRRSTMSIWIVTVHALL